MRQLLKSLSKVLSTYFFPLIKITKPTLSNRQVYSLQI
jgi:hypothetical protein